MTGISMQDAMQVIEQLLQRGVLSQDEDENYHLDEAKYAALYATLSPDAQEGLRQFISGVVDSNTGPILRRLLS